MYKFHDEIPIRTQFFVILHSCERKNLFRGKLASWNLEFCNSCVVLLRNVQFPRRNSDSHLVFRDPTKLSAQKSKNRFKDVSRNSAMFCVFMVWLTVVLSNSGRYRRAITSFRFHINLLISFVSFLFLLIFKRIGSGGD
jgi:hypothetical protein